MGCPLGQTTKSKAECTASRAGKVLDVDFALTGKFGLHNSSGQRFYWIPPNLCARGFFFLVRIERTLGCNSSINEFLVSASNVAG